MENYEKKNKEMLSLFDCYDSIIKLKVNKVCNFNDNLKANNNDYVIQPKIKVIRSLSNSS